MAFGIPDGERLARLFTLAEGLFANCGGRKSHFLDKLQCKALDFIYNPYLKNTTLEIRNPSSKLQAALV